MNIDIRKTGIYTYDVRINNEVLELSSLYNCKASKSIHAVLNERYGIRIHHINQIVSKLFELKKTEWITFNL